MRGARIRPPIAVPRRAARTRSRASDAAGRRPDPRPSSAARSEPRADRGRRCRSRRSRRRRDRSRRRSSNRPSRSPRRWRSAAHSGIPVRRAGRRAARRATRSSAHRLDLVRRRRADRRSRSRLRPITRLVQFGEDAGLEREHLALVGLVVVAAEVEDAVDRRLGQVGGVLGADHHVAQLARAGDRSGPVDREREHVGRLVEPAVLAVELADPLARRPARPRGAPRRRRPPAERRGGRRPQLGRDVREVDGPAGSIGSLAASPLVLAVGGDDPLHELVADDVLAAEPDEARCRRPAARISPITTRPERWSRGRSIWVMSPVTTIFEPKPSRVRNIFICSGLVFCASSRITNESFSVRPRMNASGATSMIPRSK